MTDNRDAAPMAAGVLAIDKYVALAERCGAEIGRYEGALVWMKFHKQSSVEAFVTGIVMLAALKPIASPTSTPQAPAGQGMTAMQALEALDELEASARGDEPFNHFAAPTIRQFIESTLAALDAFADRASMQAAPKLNSDNKLASKNSSQVAALNASMQAEATSGADAQLHINRLREVSEWLLDNPDSSRKALAESCDEAADFLESAPQASGVAIPAPAPTAAKGEQCSDNTVGALMAILYIAESKAHSAHDLLYIAQIARALLATQDKGTAQAASGEALTDEQIGQWVAEAQSIFWGAVPQARFVIGRAAIAAQRAQTPTTENP